MNKEKKLKVHFVGINGSGVSGIACIAKNKGYEVSGCDANKESDYTYQLLNNEITPIEGHNKDHLKEQDIVVLSPALLFEDKYKDIEETNFAMNYKKTMKWQHFFGQYIMKRQNIVAVCGTHGKTTTTSIVGLMLENANFDPTVLVGGKVKKWNSTFRVGESNWYVCEADEYDRNFMKYEPKYIVLNNMEMEHPEIFKDFEEYKNVFKNFIKTIQKNGIVVFNYDDENTIEILNSLKDFLKQNNIKLVAYTLQREHNKTIECKLFKTKKIDNGFNLNNQYDFHTSILGKHNIRNMAIACTLGLELNIDYKSLYQNIKNFKGTKRRMEKIHENNQVVIYDDYAHHHIQVKVGLESIKEILKPEEKLIVVFEPHMISRLKNNTKEYLKYLEIADFPIITKIFKGREAKKELIDVAEIVKGTNVTYIPEKEDILTEVKKIINQNPSNKFHIVVMGAGYSYKIAKMLVKNLKN